MQGKERWKGSSEIECLENLTFCVLSSIPFAAASLLAWIWKREMIIFVTDSAILQVSKIHVLFAAESINPCKTRESTCNLVRAQFRRFWTKTILIQTILLSESFSLRHVSTNAGFIRTRKHIHTIYTGERLELKFITCARRAVIIEGDLWLKLNLTRWA